jgi:hypothetical protein
VNLDEAWLWILQLTCPALQRLLKHKISVTTAMVMTVQRQHSCGFSELLENCLFDGWKPKNSFGTWWGLRFLMLPYWLVDWVASWYAHTTYTSSPKEKETIRYCESFGYGGQCALDRRFYRSNEVSVPVENRSNIPIMGFSLTSPYNRLFKSSP